jgi:hypothetical protein
MSLANQSNERLGQLVSLAAKIESHLSGGSASNKKGSNLGPSNNGSNSTLSKDAAVIGGLSNSLSNLIVNVNKIDPNAGDKLSMFILKMSTAVKEASSGLNQSDVDSLNKSLGSLVSGSAGFMKDMAKSALFGIPALIGATLFGATVRTLLFTLKGMPALTEESRETLKTINDIAKGSLMFGLAMAAYSVIGVLSVTGAAFFGVSIVLTFKALQSLNNFKNSEQSVKTIKDIGIAAIIFGAAMAGIGYMSDKVAKGTLVFILAVSATLIVFGLLTAALPAVKAGEFALGSIVRGAAVFAITMIGIGFFAEQFAFGTLVFTLAASALLVLYLDAAIELPAVKIGDLALGTIIKGVAVFAIAMIGIGFFAEQFAIGTLTFILAAGATLLVFGLLGGALPGIERGARGINTISKSVIPFTLAMIVAGFFPEKIVTGAIALSKAMLLVGGAAIILGLGKDKVEEGSKAILKLSIAAIAFSAALLILGLIPIDSKTLLEKIKVVAYAVLGLGLAAAVLGSISKQAEEGALILIALGVSFAIFAGTLAILAAIPVDPETMLKKLGIVALVIVGLGLAAAALGSPMVAPFAAIGAVVLGVLAVSLAIFAGAIFLLSKTDLKAKTVDQLSYAITEIGNTLAFAALLAIPMAIGAAGLIASSISIITLSLALKAFKSVEFTEDDGKSIGNAISSVVQGFVHALDGVTPMELFKAMAAIPLIGQMGNALVSLASGVKAMATLSFTEMEYDKAAGKLVPKGVVKLTDTEIQQVGPNVKKILDTLRQPLVDFGESMGEGTIGIGPFSLGGGYLEKGIEGAMKIGGIISSLALGVANMAQLNVVEYEVINPGTSKAKLVPKTVRKLTETDFTNAGTNVQKLLEALRQPLVDFGKKYAEDESLFSDSPLQKGIDGIAKIGDPLSKMADAILKMAGGQVVINKVGPDGKLVPDKTIDFATALPLAVAQANTLLMGTDDKGTGSLTGVLIKFADYINKNEDAFETSAEFIPEFEKTITSISKISTDYKTMLEQLDKAQTIKVDIGAVFTNLATSIVSVGNSFNTMNNDKLQKYAGFVSTTTKLTNIITPFEKFTKLFGTFTKDLGSFVKSWSSFGDDETNNFKTYADSLDKIAKIDVSKLKETTQIIKEQTLKQKEVSFNNSNNFARANQNQSQPAAMNTNTASGQNMNSGGNNMKPAAAEGKKMNGGIGVNPGTVIAELHVTNLYINNKLQ